MIYIPTFFIIFFYNIIYSYDINLCLKCKHFIPNNEIKYQSKINSIGKCKLALNIYLPPGLKDYETVEIMRSNNSYNKNYDYCNSDAKFYKEMPK